MSDLSKTTTMYSSTQVCGHHLKHKDGKTSDKTKIEKQKTFLSIGSNRWYKVSKDIVFRPLQAATMLCNATVPSKDSLRNRAQDWEKQFAKTSREAGSLIKCLQPVRLCLSFQPSLWYHVHCCKKVGSACSVNGALAYSEWNEYSQV